MTFIWTILALGFAVVGGIVFTLLLNTFRVLMKERNDKKQVELDVKNADNNRRANV